MLTDSYIHKGKRKELVGVLRRKHITDETVLAAILKVPRHLFVPELESAFHALVYEDRALPIISGQTISQPYTVAYQTELLEIKEGDKVLEIGTGSGYQSAVLHDCGAKVFSIERHEALHILTGNILHKLGYEGIQLKYGDGFEGWPDAAPFEKIIVTAAAPDIPEKLLQQLKNGGYMVFPLNDNKGVQNMVRITKTESSSYTTEIFDTFEFVPMLKGTVDQPNR